MAFDKIGCVAEPHLLWQMQTVVHVVNVAKVRITMID
jgi:hypothetical protein